MVDDEAVSNLDHVDVVHPRGTVAHGGIIGKSPVPRFEPRRYSPAIDDPSVLILTPVKQAAGHLDRYFALISRLAYPSHRLSLGLLESDSTDDTYARLQARLPALRERFERVTIVQRNFGFQMPAGTPRWSAPWQLTRRVTLAKSRNHLLFAALRDEDWVLWIDVDLTDYPADILTQLLSTGKDIVHPHCVLRPGGPTFDTNAWRDRGRERMDALREGHRWCDSMPSAVRCCSCGPTCTARV